MAENNFSLEQMAIIKELAEALERCKKENIHIPGIFNYEVSQFKDADGKPYVSIT